MRICIDARTAHAIVGGVQQFVIGLVSGLSRLAPDDEEYVVLADEGTTAWLAPFVSGPCRLEVVPSVLDTATLKEALARKVPRLVERLCDLPVLFKAALPPIATSSGLVERLGVELVHFPTQAAFLTSVPSIYHPHDLQHMHLPQLFTRRVRHLRDRNYRAFCAQARMVAVSSTWTRDDVVRQYALAPEKVRVIPLAPATQAYVTPSTAEVDAFVRGRRLPDRFVLYPAQTWPHKNHAGLLDALALLKSEHGLTIPLVSSGNPNTHTRTLVDRAARLGILEQVRFVGFVSPLEIQCLYRSCTAVVIPSLFEAGSFPLWEAFLAGVPAACSNVTSLPAQAGDAALVFDPRDTRSIADAVHRLWTDEPLRAALVERGHRSVSRFTWEKTATLFRAHYRRIAGRTLGVDDEALLAAKPLF